MSGNRLLVIDDDHDIGDLFVTIGEGIGYNVIHTPNPDEFKRNVVDWRPTVVITDLQMPNADGVTLLRYLAEIESDARVVIISGMGPKIISTAEDIGRQRGLHVAATIPKPFEVAKVTAILESLKLQDGLRAEDLRKSLANGEVNAFFQPKCCLRSGLVIGAEALARWRHPQLGIITPDRFLPIIDQSNLADPLLVQMAAQSVAQIKMWSSKGLDVPVALNMSAQNIASLDLPDRLEAICMRAGIPCSKLTLELTEERSLDVSADALDVLTRLRLKGFQLSIDDFGVGFSSLLRLRQLPFSELKIDRSFTVSSDVENDSAVIVQTIIAMASNLGMSCIAEGVESASTARRLVDWGCRWGQGYYFGGPMTAAEFDVWLDSAWNERVEDAPHTHERAAQPLWEVRPHVT